MVECASTIVDVCVFPGQSRIVRRGRVQLPAGPSEVLLPDIPLALQPETVRVAGRATVPVRLLGVEVSKAHHALPPEEAILELDRQIERLEDRDRALGNQVDSLAQHLEVLNGLGQAAAERLPWGLSRGTIDVAGVEAVLSSMYGDADKSREQLRRLEVMRRDLGRELERLRRERDERRQPWTPDRYSVRVPVEAEEAADLEVEITYLCKGATWRPLYDLRLDEQATGGPRVALAQLAEVSQRTAEDWSGVKLSLSTARPALAARLPELPPWYIDLYRPMARRAAVADMAPAPGQLALGAGVEEAVAHAIAEAAPPRLEATAAVAEVRSEGPAAVFVAPGLASIPADGSAHKVFLGTQDLPAPLDWVTAPKAGAHVYRRARVQNTSPAVLLPGQGSLFYGDVYVGNTAVPETPPQADFEVYLGVDDAVKVERELVDRTVEKGGLIGQVRRTSMTYRLKLHNYRAERIAVTVLEQVPVSRDESLKVKLTRSDPPTQVGDLGELRWELSLAPDEEREVVLAFQVEGPLEREVVGLP